MKDKHLPIFGVGPVYVMVIILLTFIGIYLSVTNRIPSIRIKEYAKLFLVVGVFFILLGIFLWITAALFSKLNDSIKKNQLLKTGIYAYVRNPVYSAFMFICTGIIILHSNIILMFLPFIYWFLMTIFMKYTEEKWLYALHGQEYVSYCKKVHRCIPWIRKKDG